MKNSKLLTPCIFSLMLILLSSPVVHADTTSMIVARVKALSNYVKTLSNSVKKIESGLSALCRDPAVTPCDTPEGLIVAEGDGVANDQPALQCTLDALATQGGGTLCLPAGVFRLEKRLTIRGHGMQMTGKGSNRTVLYGAVTEKSPDGDNVVRVDGKIENGLGPTNGFSIRDLGIIGQSEFHALAITNNAAHGDISRVAINGPSTAGLFMDVCGGISVQNIDIGNNDLLPAQFSALPHPLVGIKIGSETSNIQMTATSITGATFAGIQITDLDPGSVFSPRAININGGYIRMPGPKSGAVGILVEGGVISGSFFRYTGPVTISGVMIENLGGGGVEEGDTAIRMVRANNVSVWGGEPKALIEIRHSLNIMLSGVAMYGLRVDIGQSEETSTTPYSSGIRVVGGSFVSNAVGNLIVNPVTENKLGGYKAWEALGK